jgi:hypothetical protein
MPRRKLTLEQQLKGVKAAMRSPRTPPQLRKGLQRRAEQLEKQINGQAEKQSETTENTQREEKQGPAFTLLEIGSPTQSDQGQTQGAEPTEDQGGKPPSSNEEEKQRIPLTLLELV